MRSRGSVGELHRRGIVLRPRSVRQRFSRSVPATGCSAEAAVDGEAAGRRVERPKRRHPSALHRSVKDLLLFRVHGWLEENGDLRSIAEYLGFGRDARNALDAAMTELMYAERRSGGAMRVQDLTDLFFFYACDVKYARRYGTDDAAEVADRFRVALEESRYACDGERAPPADREAALLARVRDIGNGQMSRAFSVSVPLMKNRMLTDGRAVGQRDGEKAAAQIHGRLREGTGGFRDGSGRGDGHREPRVPAAADRSGRFRVRARPQRAADGVVAASRARHPRRGRADRQTVHRILGPVQVTPSWTVFTR